MRLSNFLTVAEGIIGTRASYKRSLFHFLMVCAVLFSVLMFAGCGKGEDPLPTPLPGVAGGLPINPINCDPTLTNCTGIGIGGQQSGVIYIPHTWDNWDTLIVVNGTSYFVGISSSPAVWNIIHQLQPGGYNIRFDGTPSTESGHKPQPGTQYPVIVIQNTY